MTELSECLWYGKGYQGKNDSWLLVIYSERIGGPMQYYVGGQSILVTHM